MKNLKRYIQDLEKVNPTKDDLAKTEFSYHASDKYISTFTIKITDSDKLDEINPVFTIVKECDTATFEVFSIAFSKEISSIHSYKVFGRDEADALAVDEKTNEVVKILYTALYEYETEVSDNVEINEECIMPVANSQESFLKALYHACVLQSRIIKEEIDFRSEEDLEERCKLAEQCTKEAGGDKYYNFWHQLSNCFK